MHRRQAYVLIILGLAILVLLGLGGCAGMVASPSHQRPEVVSKETWSREFPAERGVEPAWWEGFEDPVLNDLVGRAVAGNLDLGVLAARAELARIQIGQARALRLPIVAAGGRTDSMDVTGFSQSNKLGTGAEVVWELDVWGKAAKGVAAQEAAHRASQADWRAGHLVIVSSVIDGYFQIRQIDRQLGQQHRALEQGERILDIYRKLHDRGLVPATQVTRQEAELVTLRVGMKDLERARSLSQNALAALTGAAPGELRIDDTTDKAAVPVLEVPAGLPSDLLSRRPDILAAEYRLLQQVNLEGQARLGRLPTVGLTGIGGSASFGLSSLLETWTGGLSSVIQFPVFDPNVRARIRVSAAQVEVAEQEYRATVMRAFEEVESILITLEVRRAQRAELSSRREKLQEVNRLTHRQVELGLLSHLDVLEQERSLLAAEQALIENEWQIVTGTVALFKAIGGGWGAETPGMAL